MASLSPWAQDYLALLRQPVRAPSYEYLTDLCTSHLSTIPFENFTKLERWTRRAPLPSLDEWLAGVRARRVGGTCFLQNMAMRRLLTELGFTAELSEIGAKHVAVFTRVPELPGERLFLDCGSAAPIFRPLRFEKGVVDVATFGPESVCLERETEDTYCFVRSVSGNVVHDEWVFDPRHVISEDECVAIERSAGVGTSTLAMLRCNLFDLERDRVISLLNSVLTIRPREGKSTIVPLKTEQEVIDVVAGEFGWGGFPIRAALEGLAGLGIDGMKPHFEIRRRPRRGRPTPAGPTRASR